MKFLSQSVDMFIPDDANMPYSLERTTALCIAAHQDDIELMAYFPIVEAYRKPDKWFTGVVVTDGAGSPRSGVYERYTDEDMKKIRLVEQRQAAALGDYAACIQLGISSRDVKDAANGDVIADILKIIEICNPKVLYTHNLADKHDTHVAVVLRVIAACRLLPPEKRPEKIISCEVWRGLDWLCDSQKVVMDTSGHPNLSAALLGAFDSQIAGGKRYDLAAAGRRAANATFFQSHDVDETDSASFGIDITSLVNSDAEPESFIEKYIDDFKTEVNNRRGGLWR